MSNGKSVAVLAALIGFVVAPAIAWADKPPLSQSPEAGGTVYTMCSAQTATGICKRDSDEIVLNGAGLQALTFYASETTSTTYTCNIHSSSVGYDDGPTLGFQVNTTSMSEAQPVLTLSGPFSYLWITCPAINADGTLTLKALGLKLK